MIIWALQRLAFQQPSIEARETRRIVSDPVQTAAQCSRSTDASDAILLMCHNAPTPLYRAVELHTLLHIQRLSPKFLKVIKWLLYAVTGPKPYASKNETIKTSNEFNALSLSLTRFQG